MSASKKKRLGSQRRALNVQESPENSDKATNPPVPQARQRADAKADLTLSPGSEQAETSARKKKLGSQRGNKGKLQFKDVTTESGHKPIEEVEGSTTHPEVLGIKNEGIDESLESVTSPLPESDFKSGMDTTSDKLVNVPIVENYLEETPSSEEGVLSEKDQVPQMPDISEAMMPSGVILTEQEEIRVIGSHDRDNKHSTESKAGPNEEPVCQESDTSFQPTAKSRKMGSSRKKKVMDLKEPQDKDDNIAVGSELNEPMFSLQPENQPSTEGLLNLHENEDYNVNDAAVGSEAQTASSSECITTENSRLVEFADDSVNLIEQKEPLINLAEGQSIVPDEVWKGEDQDNDVNLINQVVQKEERFDSVDKVLLPAPDINVNDAEDAKIHEEEESSSQLVCDESLLQQSKTNTAEESLTAAVEVQEPVTESDASGSEEQDSSNSASSVVSESGSESSSSAEDETVETISGAPQEVKPSTEDHSSGEISISTTSEFSGATKNETDVEQDVDAHPTPYSSVSEMPESKSSSSTGLTDKTDFEDENIHLFGQQSEPLVSVAATVNSDSNDPIQEENQDVVKLIHEEIVYLEKDISSESKSLQPQVEEADISLTYTDTAAYVIDETAVKDAPSKILPMTTSNLGIEEIQVESVQIPEMSLDLNDQAPGLGNIDSTDKTDLKYSSKADEEINIVDIKDISDIQQSTEQQVSNETIGEPFADDRDTLSAKNENLPISANYDIVLSNDDKDNDGNQHKENDEPKDQRDEASDLISVQIPFTDAINTTLATTQQDATGSKEDDSGSPLIGNRRKLGSSRRIKGRRQDNDELKPEEISNMPEGNIAIEEKSQEVMIESEIVPEERKVEPIQSPEIAKDYEIQAAAPTINYHQLTYSLDNEPHEEMDNSLQDPVLEETVEAPAENVEIVDIVSHDAHHDLLSCDSKDIVYNDNDKADQIPELVEVCSAEKMLHTDIESEFQAEQINQGIVSKSEDTEESLQSGKDQTDDSIQEKDIQTPFASPDERTLELQTEIPEVMLDSFSKKDPKDKGIAEVDVDLVNTSSQPVVGSEEIISTAGFAIQSDVMSAEDIIKEQEGIQVTEVSETSDKHQINPEPKTRRMGSTRKSQLNWKQPDEEMNAEVSANILVEATMKEKDNIPPDDALPVNQGEAELAPDQQQSKESTFTDIELTQKGEEEILQTQPELIKDTDIEATTQTLLPLAGEEIQPSSPGKRRKMGSTRKNVLSKRESPLEIATPLILDKEVPTSISNDNAIEKHSDLFASTATVHPPLPDEETPLSPQVSQETVKSSGETEPSFQHEAMSEDAAIARRRKMGSHRKPHSDQIASQSEESLLHPLGERRAETPKQSQKTEAKDVDNKAVSSATAFGIKSDSGPMRDKISQQSSQPVRRVQERIRISTGYERSARKYEVVMIGDSSVGKTSFIQRAQSGRFSSDIPASIGMDSYKWIANVNGQNIVLHLWDTAGQERFRSMTKQIFHRAQAFLLMYDVTCMQTFAAVSYWANCIKDGAGESAVVLLLGNKSDCMERKVAKEDGEILAEEHSFAFMECSAATGENVIDALETVARLLCQKADSSSISEEPLMLRKPERNNKLGCC